MFEFFVCFFTVNVWHHYISGNEKTDACYHQETSTVRDETDSVTSTSGDISDDHVIDVEEADRITDNHGKVTPFM